MKVTVAVLAGACVMAGTWDARVAVSSSPSPDPFAVVDWRNTTYEVPCGAESSSIELHQGHWEDPELHDPASGSLRSVDFAGAVVVPGHADVVAVHLACLAGGVGGHASTSTLVLFDVASGTPREMVELTVPPTQDIAVAADGTITVGSPLFSEDGSDPMCCPSWYAVQTITWLDTTPTIGERVVTTAAPIPEPVANTTLTDPSVGLTVEPAVDVELGADTPPLPSGVGVTVSRLTEDRGVVAAVQLALAERGYDIGESGVDGYYGDDTAAAVAEFATLHAVNGPYDPVLSERSAGDAISYGYLDEEFLRALGIACDVVAVGQID